LATIAKQTRPHQWLVLLVHTKMLKGMTLANRALRVIIAKSRPLCRCHVLQDITVLKQPPFELLIPVLREPTATELICVQPMSAIFAHLVGIVLRLALCTYQGAVKLGTTVVEVRSFQLLQPTVMEQFVVTMATPASK
jgi:hypothetical protein